MPDFTALEPSFVASYEDVDPLWGFGGLGYTVFKRTYARPVDGPGSRLEEWPETVARCVNGAQAIGAGYTADEAHRLYDHVFHQRGLFGGRFLWVGGTEMVERQGGAALLNCMATKLEGPDDLVFLFLHLMHGAGLGFSVERSAVHDFPRVRSDVLVTHDGRTPDADFIVPDSRSGWAELLRKALEAHFYTGRSFTYSTVLIREFGAPLKTFGGTASGPGALVDMIDDIGAVLQARAGKKIRSVDALDVANIIGRAVVAGSARRSAQIALGDPDDALFMRAKNWESGTVPSWRAQSNNTIYADRYSAIPDELWNGYQGNGEPMGLFNLPLSRRVGRLKDAPRSDPHVVSINPCFAGDQLILTADGWRRFDELAGSDPLIHQDLRVTSPSPEQWDVDGRGPLGTAVVQATDVRVTARDRQLYRVTLSCGRELRLTGDHHVATERGMVKAKDLLENEGVLLPLPELFTPDKDSIDYKLGEVLGLVWSDGGLSASRETAHVQLWAETEALVAAEVSDWQPRVREVQLWLDEVLPIRSPFAAKAEFVEATVREGSWPSAKAGVPAILRWCRAKGAWKGDLGWLHAERKDLKAGFLSGFFYGDGYAAHDLRTGGGLTMRFSQSNRPLLQDLQLILQELGVLGRLYARRKAGTQLLPSAVPGQLRECKTKAAFEVIVSGNEQGPRLAALLRLGTLDEARYREGLNSYRGTSGVYATRTVSKVRSVELDSVEDVYCLSEETRRTCIVQGATVRRCGEQPLPKAGACNLAELVLPRLRSLEEAQDVAALLHRTQKAITGLRYPDPLTEEVTHRDRRVGLSVMGVCQSSDEQLSWLSDVYDSQREFDARLSQEWDVPESIRLTTVQPGGTKPLMPGVTPGASSAKAEHYIRRVRFGSGDALVPELRARGYTVQYDRHQDGTEERTRLVVDFPCQTPPGAAVETYENAIDQLERVKWLQTEWSDSAVSISVGYSVDELPKIREWLEQNYDTSVKSVSFILKTGHGFVLPPIEPVDRERYDELVSGLDLAPWKSELTGNFTPIEESCEGGSCPVR